MCTPETNETLCVNYNLKKWWQVTYDICVLPNVYNIDVTAGVPVAILQPWRWKPSAKDDGLTIPALNNPLLDIFYITEKISALFKPLLYHISVSSS